HASVIADVLSGAVIGAWCYGEPAPNDRLGAITLSVHADGDDVVLDGVKRPVESASSAGVLLVTGRSDAGLTQVLVPADAPGVSITPMQTVDLTRRFGVVTFDAVRVARDAVIGEIGCADEAVERQLQTTVALAS